MLSGEFPLLACSDLELLADPALALADPDGPSIVRPGDLDLLRDFEVEER